jgi:hypothetical protein
VHSVVDNKFTIYWVNLKKNLVFCGEMADNIGIGKIL